MVGDFKGHQDNVNLSIQAASGSPPGHVKLLIDFRDPIAIGNFVFHCHILEHQDGGMMAVAEVVPGLPELARLQAPAAIPIPGASVLAAARAALFAQASSLCRTDAPKLNLR